MNFRVLLLPHWFLLILPAAAEIDVISLGNPFDDSARDYFNLIGYSEVGNGALQITPDTRNEDSFLLNKSGRVIYKKPYKIYASINHPAPFKETLVFSYPPKKVLSFNSSFVFSIYPAKNRSAGEGLAFVILPDSESIPHNSHGGFLGLTNSSLDGNPKNQFFAVEFDTFKQPYDPDANHIGINVNSVHSIVNRSLSELNITLSPLQEEGIEYQAWVEYSGPLSRIVVYLSEITRPKPRVPVVNATIDLSNYLAEKSYFGFSASTGIQFQRNCILSWNLTVEILPERISQSLVGWFLRIGLLILSVHLLAAFCFGLLAYRRRGRREKRLTRELRDRTRTLREFPYSVLKKATRNFDVQNELGRGGYGAVYRGVIPGENTVVAVKKFHRDTMQEDFITELTMINRFRHKNLVRLLGLCHKNGTLLLVYDFMQRGSLDNHLYSQLTTRPLEWGRRVQILAGVASALYYLHNEYEQKVVHRDIKTSNIMLDAEFNARLGDFGLARLIENERNSYAELGLAGTPGYIAPECFHSGKTTLVSDVFAFGIVILEVACGRRPRSKIEGFNSLACWVWSLHAEGNILRAVDRRLGKEYRRDQARMLLVLGLACSNPSYGDRPTMREALQVILGSAPPPEVPLMRPAFTWPSDGLEGYDESTNNSQYITAETSCSGRRLHGQVEFSGTGEFLSIPLR